MSLGSSLWRLVTSCDLCGQQCKNMTSCNVVSSCREASCDAVSSCWEVCDAVSSCREVACDALSWCREVSCDAVSCREVSCDAVSSCREVSCDAVSSCREVACDAVSSCREVACDAVSSCREVACHQQQSKLSTNIYLDITNKINARDPFKIPINSCESLLWVAPVSRSCESLLWVAPVSRSCESLLWVAHVSRSFESLMWVAPVSRSCESLLWVAPVSHPGQHYQLSNAFRINTGHTNRNLHYLQLAARDRNNKERTHGKIYTCEIRPLFLVETFSFQRFFVVIFPMLKCTSIIKYILRYGQKDNCFTSAK